MLNDVADRVIAMENASRLHVESRPSGAPIRVAFVSDFYAYWNCYASVAAEFSRRSTFAPVVLPLPCPIEGGDAGRIIQEAVYPFKPNELPFVSEEKYNIHREQPDVVFFQSPYTGIRGLKYYPAVLHTHNTRSVLIPYCTEFMGGANFLAYIFPGIAASGARSSHPV